MNKGKPNISIIVPVYNVEKYLVRCLDSIFKQPFLGTFEVIAVDDGSTDNSLQILKNYQEKEARLKIIEHGVNKRQSIARTNGMKAAAGDYIMHVDSDDWLMPDILENLYQKCLKANVDIVAFNYLKENEKGERTYVNGITKELITTDKQKAQPFFYGASVTKMVKRELTENMIYGEYGYPSTGDLIYCSEILLKAGKILVLPESLYVYFENPESITMTSTPIKYLANQRLILNSIEHLVSKYNPNAEFVKNVLNYFEKWIFLSIANNHLFFKDDFMKRKENISFLFNSQLLSQNNVNRIVLCLNNRFISLLEVTSRFGFRMTYRIISSYIRKTLTNLFQNTFIPKN